MKTAESSVLVKDPQKILDQKYVRKRLRVWNVTKTAAESSVLVKDSSKDFKS